MKDSRDAALIASLTTDIELLRLVGAVVLMAQSRKKTSRNRETFREVPK